LNCNIKIWLYESLVWSTLLYAAKTWSMTVTNMKKLEAAHHKWQRRILGVVWRDKVSNEMIRQDSYGDLGGDTNKVKAEMAGARSWNG